MKKQDFETYHKLFRDFEILTKISETHVFGGTIRHPSIWNLHNDVTIKTSRFVARKVVSNGGAGGYHRDCSLQCNNSLRLPPNAFRICSQRLFSGNSNVIIFFWNWNLSCNLSKLLKSRSSEHDTPLTVSGCWRCASPIDGQTRIKWTPNSPSRKTFIS